jgi:hypothetical protein
VNQTQESYAVRTLPGWFLYSVIVVVVIAVFIPLSKSGRYNCTLVACCFASEISAVCGAVSKIFISDPKKLSKNPIFPYKSTCGAIYPDFFASL